jgi:beta-glucosidase
VTFPASAEDLPAFDDYAMAGRTYRFSAREPLWRFGHGRSFSRFRYSELRIDRDASTVRVVVENLGPRDGDEVVQLYVTLRDVPPGGPRRSLVGFTRVRLAAFGRRQVVFTIDEHALRPFDEHGGRGARARSFLVAVGGGQPDDADRYASDEEGLVAAF